MEQTPWKSNNLYRNDVLKSALYSFYLHDRPVSILIRTFRDKPVKQSKKSDGFRRFQIKMWVADC